MIPAYITLLVPNVILPPLAGQAPHYTRDKFTAIGNTSLPRHSWRPWNVLRSHGFKNPVQMPRIQMPWIQGPNPNRACWTNVAGADDSPCGMILQVMVAVAVSWLM